MGGRVLRLQLVLGKKECFPRSLLDVVSEAIKGGVTLVQLREKEASDAEMVETGRALHAFLKPLGIPLLLNDRVHLVEKVGAEGVHIGQADLSYAEARRILGPDKIIGLTIENEAQGREALSMKGLNYVGVGPIFSTQTKLDAPPVLGLENLESICKQFREAQACPVIAIGGINLKNVGSVLRAGAAGVAVVSAICHAAHPQKVALAFSQCFLEKRISPGLGFVGVDWVARPSDGLGLADIPMRARL